MCRIDNPTGARRSTRRLPQWPDIDPHYLVLSTNRFIVWIDEDIDVDWKTSDEYDSEGPKDPIRHNGVLHRAGVVECIPNSHHTRIVRTNFKRMIAEAIALSLKHDYESAESILDIAEAYIAERNTELARYWQLGTACCVGATCLCLAVAQWTFRTPLIALWGEKAFFLLIAGLAGCTGALLSMSLRMGRLLPTSEAPRKLHILEAFSRILAGGICGAVIAASVQAGIISSAAMGGGQLHLFMAIVAVGGGLSERWAPSLVSRMHDRLDESTGGGDL